MTTSRFRPSLPLTVLGVLSMLVVMLCCPSAAQAAFTGTVTGGPLAVSTATLAAPTGVTLGTACGVSLVTTPTMTATWTASSSTWAGGYTVTPYLNGVAQTPVTVSGQATTTKTFNITRNPLVGSNVWTFTVTATFNSWVSTAVSPTPASATCPFLSL